MAGVFLIDANTMSRRSPFISLPYGLLGLAAVLRRAGHRVAVHDGKMGLDGVWRRLEDFRPELVGLRALTTEPRTLEIILDGLRRRHPGVPIVIGGPHASAAPEHVLSLPGVSAVVQGEGEEALLELVERLPAGGTPEGLKGVAWSDGGTLRGVGERTPRIRDLDSLPLAAYDLVEVERYFSTSTGGTAPNGRTAINFSSRGCPFHCAFCHEVFAGGFIGRSPESVLSEAAFLKTRYGIEEIEYHDDSFTTNRSRALEIFEGFARRDMGLSLAFPNGLRAETLTDEIVDAMKAAGTVHACVSPETATPRLQEMVGKRMNLDRARSSIRRLVSRGFYTHGYFMLGFPGETEQEMLETVRWAVESPLHTASFHILAPFPGTRIRKIAEDMGRLEGQEFGIEDYFSINVNVSDVPDERFREIFSDAYRRFYSRPSRLLGIWRTFPAKRRLLVDSLFVLRRML